MKEEIEKLIKKYEEQLNRAKQATEKSQMLGGLNSHAIAAGTLSVHILTETIKDLKELIN